MAPVSFLEFSLALLCLAVLYYLHVRSRRKNPLIPLDWPVVGMLPRSSSTSAPPRLGHVLLQHHPAQLPPHRTTALKEASFTSDPANVRHVFTSTSPTTPKGTELAEIMDILGGIFNADGDSGVASAPRRSAHVRATVFGPSCPGAAASKVERDLLPLLDRIAATSTGGV
ncbi:hypothetical protein ZWY2020_011393 [Hordeum vulgare]|nr:hypothetical protein ZWY2020_011393 [Hordeum vulgare]